MFKRIMTTHARSFSIKTLSLALAVTLTGTLAACGGDSSQTKSDKTAAGEQLGATQLSADRGTAVVEKIQRDSTLAAELPEQYRDKEIRIGSGFSFPPLRYDQEGRLAGAEADLARASARLLGTDAKFIQVAFDGLVPAIHANRIDMIVSSMADFPVRRKQVTFVDYYKSATALEVRKGNPKKLSDLASLCGASVAIQQGVESVQRVQAQTKRCVAEGKKPVDLQLYESSNDATLAVVSGRADATANDYPAALHETRTVGDGNALELTAKPISSSYVYGFGYRVEDKQLQTVFQKALQKLMDDGSYKKIYAAYGIDQGLIDKSGINMGPAPENVT